MSDFIVDNYKPPEINFQILFQQSYNNHLDLKTKKFIIKLAIEYLNKYYRLFDHHIYKYEELLKIDYDNFIVSKNFKQHPLYNTNCSIIFNDYTMKYYFSFTSVSPHKFM